MEDNPAGRFDRLKKVCLEAAGMSSRIDSRIGF